MAVKSISKNLLKITEKLDIKLSVSILDNQRNNSLYSYYCATPQTSYFIININSFVGITYKDKTGQWDSNKRIKINNNNIYQLVVGLKKARNNLYHPQLFVYHDDGDISVNVDIAKRQTVDINNLLDGQCVQIIPSVVYDTDEQAMVGVMMYINNSEYCIDLSVDEFETFVYFFENFNIGTETQLAVNMFLTEQMAQMQSAMLNKQNTNQPSNNDGVRNTSSLRSDNTRRVIVFKDDDVKKEAGVSGYIHKSKRPMTLDEL